MVNCPILFIYFKYLIMRYQMSYSFYKNLLQSAKRFYSKRVAKGLNNEEVQNKRVSMFIAEQKRQAALVTDIEKIEVYYKGVPEDCTLIMNKQISTPFDCAQHLSTMVKDRSVLAEVNGQVWDLHRPLAEDCTLRLLHFRQPDPYYVNKAFWRSCSIMLGAVIENAFKTDLYVELCSFPAPNVRTGSFIYDVNLKLENWKPSINELRILSAEMVNFSSAGNKFERLDVDVDLALKMFEDNRYKRIQIPHIAALSPSGSNVTLYKVSNFVDISCGPLINHTAQVGKCTVAAVHCIKTDREHLYRFQAVALPRVIMNAGKMPVIAEWEEKTQQNSVASQELM